MNRRRAFVLLLITSLPVACTRVGVPREASPPRAPEDPSTSAAVVREAFTGYATLTGHRIPVALTLTGIPGRNVSATFEAPEIDLNATGQGGWDGDVVTVEMSYGDGCPGVLTLRLTRDPAGRLQGSVAARDCTGSANGPVDLIPTRSPASRKPPAG